jgi:hypothetical protein
VSLGSLFPGSLLVALKGFFGLGFLGMPHPLEAARFLFINDVDSFRLTKVYILIRSLSSGMSSFSEKQTRNRKIKNL